MPREEDAISIVRMLLGDYARGEARGGYMEWEDVNTTAEVAKSLFPDLWEEIDAEVKAEYAESDDE